MILPRFSLAACLLLTSCRALTPTASLHPQFTRDIRPILEQRCAACHNKKLLSNGWSVENRALAFASKPGIGAIIVPGSPDKSLLIKAITVPDSHPQAMPILSDRVPAREVELLRQWIADGASWPADASGDIVPPRSAVDF